MQCKHKGWESNAFLAWKTWTNHSVLVLKHIKLVETIQQDDEEEWKRDAGRIRSLLRKSKRQNTLKGCTCPFYFSSSFSSLSLRYCYYDSVLIYLLSRVEERSLPRVIFSLFLSLSISPKILSRNHAFVLQETRKDPFVFLFSVKKWFSLKS